VEQKECCCISPSKRALRGCKHMSFSLALYLPYLVQKQIKSIHSPFHVACLQSAFNIAYIGLAWHMKHPRPYHLSTPDVQERWRALGWVP